MNPLARGIEELLPERISENIWCFLLLRTALVASSVCSAFLIPFFGKNVKHIKVSVYCLMVSIFIIIIFCEKLAVRSCDGSDRIFSQYTCGYSNASSMLHKDNG